MNKLQKHNVPFMLKKQKLGSHALVAPVDKFAVASCSFQKKQPLAVTMFFSSKICIHSFIHTLTGICQTCCHRVPHLSLMLLFHLV